MLTMLIIATIVSTVLELVAVKKLKLMPWFVKYPVLEAAFSILLSILIGTVFGISGLILVTATIASSIITLGVYGAYRMIHKIKAMKGQEHWLAQYQVNNLITKLSTKKAKYALYPSLTTEQALINLGASPEIINSVKDSDQ